MGSSARAISSGPERGVSAMQRSSRGRREHQTDSRSSAPAGRGTETTLPLRLGAVPRQRHPSEGILIKASVLARLLGLRLLTLDATITLAPAKLPAGAAGDGALPAVAPRSFEAVPLHFDGLDRGLAEAVRNMDEGARLLAQARGSRPLSVLGQPRRSGR